MTTDPNSVTTLDGSLAEPISFVLTKEGEYYATLATIEALCASARECPGACVNLAQVESIVFELVREAEGLLKVWQ